MHNTNTHHSQHAIANKASYLRLALRSGNHKQKKPSINNIGINLRGKSAFLRHGYRVLTKNQNHRTKENQPSRTSQTGPEAVPPTDTQAVPYERRFSLLLRFWKLLISPSEAMRDIALAPDYIGPTFIVVLEVIVAAIAIWGTMQKFNQIGSSQYISTVWVSLV